MITRGDFYMIDDTHLPCHRGVCVDSPFLWLRAERDHHPEPHRAAHARLGREPAGASGLWHGPRLALRSRWTRLTLSGGRRVPGRRDLRECLVGGAWVCPGDDRAAEWEASRAIPEAPAGGEGGKTGAVEVKEPG